MKKQKHKFGKSSTYQVISRDIDRLKKDTSNYNLLSYSETIKNQNKT
jgi:hypothetical protein